MTVAENTIVNVCIPAIGYVDFTLSGLVTQGSWLNTAQLP